MAGPSRESLDEIVSHSAVVLADQIQKAAAWAKSEMDLQIEISGVTPLRGSLQCTINRLPKTISPLDWAFPAGRDIVYC